MKRDRKKGFGVKGDRKVGEMENMEKLLREHGKIIYHNDSRSKFFLSFKLLGKINRNTTYCYISFYVPVSIFFIINEELLT